MLSGVYAGVIAYFYHFGSVAILAQDLTPRTVDIIAPAPGAAAASMESGAATGSTIQELMEMGLPHERLARLPLVCSDFRDQDCPMWAALRWARARNRRGAGPYTSHGPGRVVGHEIPPGVRDARTAEGWENVDDGNEPHERRLNVSNDRPASSARPNNSELCNRPAASSCSSLLVTEAGEERTAAAATCRCGVDGSTAHAHGLLTGAGGTMFTGSLWRSGPCGGLPDYIVSQFLPAGLMEEADEGTCSNQQCGTRSLYPHSEAS